MNSFTKICLKLVYFLDRNVHEVQGTVSIFMFSLSPGSFLHRIADLAFETSCIFTWCVQVLRSPEEAFAAAMQSCVSVVKNVYVYRVITLRNDCIFSFLW